MIHHELKWETCYSEGSLINRVETKVTLQVWDLFLHYGLPLSFQF
jgi:hypothetical protein